MKSIDSSTPQLQEWLKDAFETKIDPGISSGDIKGGQAQCFLCGGRQDYAHKLGLLYPRLCIET